MTHPHLAEPAPTPPLPYPSLAGEDPVSVLQLIRSDNVGPITFFNLLRFYGSADKAIEAIPNLTKKADGRRKVILKDRNEVEKEYKATQSFGAHFVLYGADNYPAHLAQIHDPPPILAVRGNPTYWAKDCIGIVGARNASANGCNFARTIATELGKENISIISGLARGIDAFAHSGALATGSIGVIAGGIDNIYPPQNESLFNDMATQGAIISENPFGAEPQARHFPSRNRIIAGISRGIVVVEAAYKSGTLITANYALDYGRDVFAVPGSPLDPRCVGTNDLLKEGAHLITCADDILRQLREPKSLQLAERPAPHFTAAPTPEPDTQEAENAREAILAKLSATPLALDELINQCQYPAAIVQYTLLELELTAEVTRHPGGTVSKVY